MIHIELTHMKQHMVAAFNTRIDEIKEEVTRQLEAKISAAGFQEEVSKMIEHKLHGYLQEYVGRLVRNAMHEKEDILKALVMGRITKLMAEDQIEKLMQE